jgi:hypothetical protein
MQIKDFNPKRFDISNPLESYNNSTFMFIINATGVVKAFGNNQWPLN